MSDTVTLVENHGTQSVVEQDEADKLLLLGGHDRYEVEWDAEARVTPMGSLVFFAQYIQTSGLMDRLCKDTPLAYRSNNAPKARDVLGTFFKVIKAGVGEGTGARVFVTGVLPVTMDDLTSGFNIGQIITLEPHVLNMMGFTQGETDVYLDENFFRTTFFELCTRYLYPDFMFAIEVNRASGRSDWEAIGRAGTPFENRAAIIGFKHYSQAKAGQLGVRDWTEPPSDAVEQVSAYAADLQRDYPNLSITRHVVCTVGAADYRFFDLSVPYE